MMRLSDPESDTLIVQNSRGSSPRQKQIIAGGIAVVVSIALVVVLVMLLAVRPKSNSPAPTQNKIKNVIMMVSDGWGPAAATLARSYSGKALALDPYLVGTIRTLSADSLVTDSAAGATSYSCGKHTYNGGIGVDANAVACGTVLEAASKKGMRTGVVTTTRVTDATPAAFASHSADRSYEDYIALQELDLIGFAKDMDVILGGGRMHFNARTDGQDLLQKAVEKGYTVALNASALDMVTGGKVLGLFADRNMAYTIDRNVNETLQSLQPSLSTMTRKALELLNTNNENGFFVMLEGALIDVAEHANDAASAVREILGYNEAFSIALEFAQNDGHTVIISTSDHETGGLTLGLQTNFAPGAYPEYAYYPQLLEVVNASCDTMAGRILNGENITTVIASSTNIALTDAEIAYIQQYTTFSDISGAIGKTVSARSLIGFTTHGHTGVDVNLYIYGLPNGTQFSANQENINVATLIANILELDLSAMTAEVQNFPTEDNTTQVTKTTRPYQHHY